MDPIPVYTVGISLLVVLVVILLAVRKSKQSKQSLENLSASLGATELVSGSTYEGELDGQIYQYQYFAGSNNSPSYFKVWVKCDSAGEFTIRSESRFDSFAKRLGLSAEIQTGDKQFDKEFYIQTDSIAFSKNFFSDLRKRDAARQLYAAGYNQLIHDGKTMEARVSPFSIDNLGDSEMIEEAIRNLVTLCRELPASYYQSRMLGTHAWKANRFLVFAISGLSIAFGIGGIVWGLRSYPPLDSTDMLLYSVQFSITALAAFIFLAVLLIRGRSSSHKELLIVLLMTLIGFPMAGFGGLILLNGYLDESDTSVRPARVDGRRVSKSRNSTSYYVSVESWRQGHDVEEIKVPHDTYSRAKPAETVMVLETREGRYGFEWIEGYQIERAWNGHYY
jgi:hypothetical protein